jgi:hypothetical protein
MEIGHDDERHIHSECRDHIAAEHGFRTLRMHGLGKDRKSQRRQLAAELARRSRIRGLHVHMLPPLGGPQNAAQSRLVITRRAVVGT